MQFLDICLNPSNPSPGNTPYLIIVQGDYVQVHSTRVVVPLMKLEAVSPIIKGGLMPEFTVEGHHVVMVTPELAGISISEIGPVVANALDRHHDVRRAIDILTGNF
ncbi:CcdB family protein [Telmatospirillum siberiense]|uniref:Toxin CcdB n=1 Tax=Telmatospirillum siberiense TaxID=382514 RepID=A0A2N3PM52_9PROT|nr:CcdB family protein [Telmatospirillum siberiense]PKU21488.1 plasmid maintenance protein CcdB [Telmatospirillum siberiense]